MRLFILSFAICFAIGCGTGKTAIYRQHPISGDTFGGMLMSYFLENRHSFIYADPLYYHYKDSVRYMRLKVLDGNWGWAWKEGDTIDLPLIMSAPCLEWAYPFFERVSLALRYESEELPLVIYSFIDIDSVHPVVEWDFGAMTCRGVSCLEVVRGWKMDTSLNIDTGWYREFKPNSSVHVERDTALDYMPNDQWSSICPYLLNDDLNRRKETYALWTTFYDWYVNKQETRYTGADTLWLADSKSQFAVAARFKQGKLHGKLRLGAWGFSIETDGYRTRNSSILEYNGWVEEMCFNKGKPVGDWSWWLVYDTLVEDPNGTKEYRMYRGVDTSRHLSEEMLQYYRAMEYDEDDIRAEELEEQEVYEYVRGREYLRWVEYRLRLSPQGKVIESKHYMPYNAGYIAPDTIAWQWRGE